MGPGKMSKAVDSCKLTLASMATLFADSKVIRQGHDIQQHTHMLS